MNHLYASYSLPLPSMQKDNLKFDSTIGTDTTSQNLVGKKISLDCCSSSLSLQTSNKDSLAAQLFARFLANNDQKDRSLYLFALQQYYNSMQNQEDGKIYDSLKLSRGKDDIEGQVLSHFIQIWLRRMGYGSKRNKKYVMGRMKLTLGPQVILAFCKIYQNLGEIPLNYEKRLNLLLQTCKNGWEYFVYYFIQHEQLKYYLKQQENKHQMLLKVCRARTFDEGKQ